jgi:SAM-dependent methyltransferase
MSLSQLTDRMRAEWNDRAAKDAHFYVAFGRENQQEDDFLATAAEVVPTLEMEFARLPPGAPAERRALEIGCGPGRLLLPMSRYFGEIHGVDVSEEMAALARERLQNVPNAHVHATSGVDLHILEDAYFDFVYSYIVFQHIPSQEIVLNYLREARRVLKPGGILRCQIRGIAPPESEMIKENETWTGCYFTPDEIAAFARRQSFPLVAISGIDTQYMWTTFRKPLLSEIDSAYAPERIVVNAVTAANGPETRIPARGANAAVSLWIDGMPQAASLADCAVLFRDREQMGCYLSRVSASGACQLNAILPGGIVPGEYDVSLKVRGQAVIGVHQLTVIAPPPLSPRVISVTDGINLTSPNVVETGGAKVFIADVMRPAEVAFTVAGRKPPYINYRCENPITDTWEFSFHLAPETPRGRQWLKVRVEGRELPPVELQVL